MSFLLDLWSDTAGKIFLITFVSYLAAYLVYGGYVYTFFGRNVGLPFGLADFSIADLISIFPAMVITLVHTVSRAIGEFLKGL
ncbi:MAG: hypothetical protein GYA59_11060, partial [Chloroflexi bacterium]|nr:hypothetical protein [Chloroflexota bacterium]